MTLVIAIRCSNGVVIGADSASTEEDLKLPVDKIGQIPGAPILYSGSGHGGLIEKLDAALQSVKVQSTLRKTRTEIRKATAPEYAESIRHHVAYPAMLNHQPPIGVLLFAGVLDSEPFILELEKDNTDTLYDDRQGNFAAIGSGKSLAHALFRPHLNTQRDIELGKYFAYRILDDAIQLSAMYLGYPINIQTVSLDGTIEKVEAAELEHIQAWCGGWRELERETVEEMLTGDWGESRTDIPKP